MFGRGIAPGLLPLPPRPNAEGAALVSEAQIAIATQEEFSPMKLTLLIGAAAGYVLGARAGRQRYESIVRMARAVAGSPPVQSGAHLAQSEAGDLTIRLRHAVGRLLTHDAPPARR